MVLRSVVNSPLPVAATGNVRACKELMLSTSQWWTRDKGMCEKTVCTMVGREKPRHVSLHLPELASGKSDAWNDLAQFAPLYQQNRSRLLQ